MWNWLADNWMTVVAFVFSVVAFFRAGHAEQRSKRQFNESHEVKWEPFIQESEFLFSGQIDILFRNVASNSYAKHVWYSRENQRRASVATTYTADDEGIEKNGMILVRLANKQALRDMPDRVRLEWTTQESLWNRVSYRIRHLFSEDEFSCEIHHQDVSIYEARAKFLDETDS